MNKPKTQREAVDLDRLVRLPKWAQLHISELEARVQRAEATIPWTEPGMEWFTLLKDSEPETIFLCSRNGTHPIASIGKGDRVFVGRACKPNAVITHAVEDSENQTQRGSALGE